MMHRSCVCKGLLLITSRSPFGVLCPKLVHINSSPDARFVTTYVLTGAVTGFLIVYTSGFDEAVHLSTIYLRFRAEQREVTGTPRLQYTAAMSENVPDAVIVSSCSTLHNKRLNQCRAASEVRL
jgi:hypothetical protein